MYKKTPDAPFIGFPKISRYSRPVVVTEKIDGTNAQVYVSDDGEHVSAGSRTRWIEPEADNYGFAAWVRENHEELRRLGPGSHFGEWWGQGIQRNYGLKEKRFSLFNVGRWSDEVLHATGGSRPSCCSVVPIIWQGQHDDLDADELIYQLSNSGSVAVPGWMKPEGIVIFHVPSQTLFKKLVERDSEPKGQ